MLDGSTQPSPRCPVESLHESQIELVHGFAIGGLQEGRGHAPRLADGRFPARHGHFSKGPGTLEPLQVREQELAAPHVPVRTIARAIPRDADHSPIDAVVGKTARDVRVMMLDRDKPDAIESLRIGG